MCRRIQDHMACGAHRGSEAASVCDPGHAPAPTAEVSPNSSVLCEQQHWWPQPPTLPDPPPLTTRDVVVCSALLLVGLQLGHLGRGRLPCWSRTLRGSLRLTWGRCLRGSTAGELGSVGVLSFRPRTHFCTWGLVTSGCPSIPEKGHFSFR